MPRDIGRPYAQHSIIELEAIFAEHRDDARTIEKLRNELTFRSTDRAARLRDKLTPTPTSEPKGGRAARKSKAKSAQPQAPAVQRHADTYAKPAPAEHSIAAPPPLSPPATAPRFTTPNAANEPASLLAAWTAFEALSPQTYRRPEDRAGGDRRCVADLTDPSLPWKLGERSRPNRQLFYQIFLGAVHMDKATERLTAAFGIDEERSSRVREKAALGAILVDRNGCLLEEKAVAISSFGWALPLALELRLGELGSWPALESRLVEQLERTLRSVDNDGKPIPLDAAAIERGYRWILNEFHLPEDLVEPPTFAIRTYHYFKSRNLPEVSLLNSFFLGDLARAQTSLRAGELQLGIKKYLGLEVPTQTFDLQQNRGALEVAVSPALMPAARWPSPGGHPLVLLQQAAVNLARRELEKEGLIAVNGPPGTGKTTLLRDMVAGAVLDRALAMAAFDDPVDAFTATGSRVSAGANAYFHLYRLSPSLRGHEVVVASSNNKAVENVSRELPAMAAIGRDPAEWDYFRSISDIVYGSEDDQGSAGDDANVQVDPVETWGMIAAVLGNRSNRFLFGQNFWWHNDRGFRIYLKAAKGDAVVREIRDPETGKVIKRETPSVVTLERPPTPQLAALNWRRASKRLISLHREVETELKALEAIRQTCLQLGKALSDLKGVEAALIPLIATVQSAKAIEVKLREPRDRARLALDRCIAALQSHRLDRPGFFARLFGTERARAWLRIQLNLASNHVAAEEVHSVADKAHRTAQAALDSGEAKLRECEQARHIVREKVSLLTREIEAHRPALGPRIVDASFFAQGHEMSNLTAPWIPDSLHRKRENLFLAALQAHRAFVDAAAQKVLHNLSVLMGVLSEGPPQDEAKRNLLGEMWSTLFLVVPVISTTFASVEAMFGELKSNDIGWLLIDEAGQALPQAAVGAIMRARRTVVVGDPLQIPPVVSLPERLNSEICRFFKIDKPLWAAPDASAQTVADRASRFRGSFGSEQGLREVGIPLLVHRRCQNPMFSFANEIAYDNQMVHAPGPRKAGEIGACLGPSAWLDVDGEAASKWCPDEGELVVDMLKALADARISGPDLFIVTPFRIVAQELRRRLEGERALFAAFGVDRERWLTDRVGTIHTVQGREADTVILVLGAPAAAQGGARGWAAGTPNILNVAVSRAKQNFYVVGSYGAWSGVGHAATLARLPRSAAPNRHPLKPKS